MEEGFNTEVGRPAMEMLNDIFEAFKNDPKEWARYKAKLDAYRETRMLEEDRESQIVAKENAHR